MINTTAASRYSSGSGSDKKMRLLAAQAPQHWIFPRMVELFKSSSSMPSVLSGRKSFITGINKTPQKKLKTVKFQKFYNEIISSQK
jgi:hypothetical protein